MTTTPETLRTCLHCALARALQAEAPAFTARGLAVHMTRSDPVFLPGSGRTIYRGLRRLLAAARDAAERGPVRLAVVEVRGKSHVEVTAVVAQGARWRVLARAFPQFVPAALPGGFNEHAAG